MNWEIIIPLIIFGLLLVFTEIFLLPGFIVGIVGGVIVIFALYKTYDVYGISAAAMTTLITIAVFVIFMVIFFKSKTWKKVALSDTIDGKVNVIDSNINPGDKGKTISRLAPMGKAIINNEYYEVTTNGEFIDENEDISVIKIEGNKIFIKKENNN